MGCSLLLRTQGFLVISIRYHHDKASKHIIIITLVRLRKSKVLIQNIV